MHKSIYIKTEAGRAALKERAADLSPKLRSAFIMFDGVRTLAEVLTATSGLGVTEAEMLLMVERGYLALTEGAAVARPAPVSPAPVSSPSLSVPVQAAASVAARSDLGSANSVQLTTSQDRYQRGYPIAAQLTAGLGLRGFRLNLAVEGAGNLEQLRALAPKIREVVGADKCRELDWVLGL